MKKVIAKRQCDMCPRSCTLTESQHECYSQIPADIDSVWHPCFDDPTARSRFFGPKAREVEKPSWILFPEIPDGEMRAPKKTVLTKQDEAYLFLQYNYARFRLKVLSEKQEKSPTKTRALAMLEWHERMQSVRTDLVSANMSLVVAMAKRTRIPNVEFPELVSEGNMALLRAIDKFDVSRGFKFSTYACRAILKGFNRMATKAGTYHNRFGISYDPEMEPSDQDARRHEMQQARAIEDVQEIITQNRARLSEIEQTVIIERFGLLGGQKRKTLAEVGKILQLSNERIRQLQKKAMVKIRQVLDERYLAA